MGISVSGGGSVNVGDLQGILPPNTIEHTRLNDTDSISWRESVPSGYTVKVISLEALNSGADHVNGLKATAQAESGGLVTADGELIFDPDDPVLSIPGPDTIRFQLTNDTGSTLVASAAFRYIFEEA